MSKIWYFSGKAFWSRPYTPDSKYDKYDCSVFLDEASWQKFKEAGLEIKIRKDKEGKEFVTFARRAHGFRKGQVVDYGAPVVLNKNGDPIKDIIGLGSDITVKVEVFDLPTGGKGHRLEAIRVDELVEVVKREVDEDIDEPF